MNFFHIAPKLHSQSQLNVLLFPARYQQEFDGDLSTEMAERFYHQAIYINPDLGTITS
jgi:hypothetical protein